MTIEKADAEDAETESADEGAPVGDGGGKGEVDNRPMAQRIQADVQQLFALSQRLTEAAKAMKEGDVIAPPIMLGGIATSHAASAIGLYVNAHNHDLLTEIKALLTEIRDQGRVA